jgi:hypothetical protein
MKLITTSVFVFGIFVQNIFGQSMTFNPGKHSTTWMQKQQIIFQYASDTGQFNTAHQNMLRLQMMRFQKRLYGK